jgi:hypothetical protein
MPYSSTTGWSNQEQGLQSVLATIEARLQSIEQAVFGGNYLTQQNLGVVADLNEVTLAGPGQSVQAGQVSAGNR